MQAVGRHMTDLTLKGGEALAHLRRCGCSITGIVQGQVGWGLRQPGVVEGVPALAGVEWDDL